MISLAAFYGDTLRGLPGLLLPSRAEFRDLAGVGHYPPAVSAVRSRLIIARVRQVAAVFAILTLAWIVVDATSFPRSLWIRLAAGRVVTSAVFALLAATPFAAESSSAAQRALASLIAVPLVFFFFALVLLENDPSEPAASGLAVFAYLPCIVAAGLSIFPLAALESAALGCLPVLAMAAAAAIWPGLADHHSLAAAIWRTGLILGIAGLAAISQLRLLLSLTEHAIRDGLTGLLVRGVGAELLEQQFALSMRTGTPLALFFIDLDNFKAVNDSFGHEAGDAVLREVGATLRRAFRQQDILLRWGGEEFLVALPGTEMADAEAKLRKLAVDGIGTLPDGRVLTASIGGAERKIDVAAAVDTLIDLADRRMYAAKRAGRNCYVLCDAPVAWIGSALEPGSVSAGKRHQ